MVRIILLADQERLIRLFTDPDALPGVKVLVASFVEDALAAISAKAPHLVFIQERLGEVSGEIIAHRLGNDLKGKRSRIVLIGDPSGSAVAAAKPACLLLDAALPDDQLAEAVRRTVSSSLPGTGKRRGAQRKKPAPNDASLPAEPTAPPLPADAIADVVALGGNASSAKDTPDRREPTNPPGDALPAGSSFAAHLENVLEGKQAVDPRGDTPETQPPAAPPEPPGGSVPAAVAKPALLSRVLQHATGSKKAVIALLSLAGLLLILSLAVVLPGKRQGEQGSNARTEQGDGNGGRKSSAVPAPSLRELPSFIPGQAGDAGYGATHPGWERYLDPAAEFRVYRELGIIRAIQIIDRGNGGIAPGLFAAALKEVAGDDRYLVETRERKGAYLVEKGRLQNGAGIIVYRREPERRVKAFVVDLR